MSLKPTEKFCPVCNKFFRSVNKYCSRECLLSLGTTNQDSFWLRVLPQGECKFWVGSITVDGYGRFYDKISKKYHLAHRYLWELEKGPIPPGYSLANLPSCGKRNCVNLQHWKVVKDSATFQREAAKHLPVKNVPKELMPEINFLSVAGYSVNDIAKEMSLTPLQVMSVLSRAKRAKMKAALAVPS